MVQLYKKFELAQSIWLDTCLALAKQESKATNSNQSIKKQVIETVFCLSVCLYFSLPVRAIVAIEFE